MSLVHLFEPTIDQGIRNTNFVNGRVLAAEDLRTEQSAARAHLRQLGRAVGDGVSYGLEVTKSAASVAFGQQVVHVTRGLALNRNGEAVHLAVDIDVVLAKDADSVVPSSGLFSVCQPPQTVFTNPGLYVLTIMPASGYEGRVPVVDLDAAGIGTSCSSRFATEGVTFRMARIDVATSAAPTSLKGFARDLDARLAQPLVDLRTATGAAADALRLQIAPDLSKLRNVVAHLCFGTERLARFAADPFGWADDALGSDYGALDELRARGALTPCEVPLAVLYWSRVGIEWVDAWSARRPLVPQAPDDTWSPLVGRRSPLERSAVFLQFQAQVEELLASGMTAAALARVRANDYFRYLPPAGVIPLGGFGQTKGLDSIEFFSGHTTRLPAYIEGTLVQPLMRESFLYDPVDLSDQQMMWLYSIRENVQAGNVAGATRPRTVLIFATGHIPYRGDAHFDLSRWNFSNVSLAGD